MRYRLGGRAAQRARDDQRAAGNYTLAVRARRHIHFRRPRSAATPGASATIHVTYPNAAHPGPDARRAHDRLLSDDFESGNLNNWAVTGGSAQHGHLE